MEIVVGDVHGCLKQFLYPFFAKGLCEDAHISHNEIVFEKLDLHDARIIFCGDIFYRRPEDCIIANTLARLVLEHENIEWLLGNHDVTVFAKIIDPTIEMNKNAHGYSESPFERFAEINRERLLNALTSKRIKVVTRLKNNMLVSHAAINQEAVNELKHILDIQDVLEVFNPEFKTLKNNWIPVNPFDHLEDLNDIFTNTANLPLFQSKLKIFWNKRIFNAVEECVIGHEVFANEYPKEAYPKIQKFGSWLTDEYMSMNVQCQEDRAKQFLLKSVNYLDAEITVNVHHTDCNATKYENPCFFVLEDDVWYFNGGLEIMNYEIVEINGHKWKFEGTLKRKTEEITEKSAEKNGSKEIPEEIIEKVL